MIPSLNLRGVRRDPGGAPPYSSSSHAGQQQQQPTAESGKRTPSENENVDSFREYTPAATPMQPPLRQMHVTNAPDAREFLGCSVYDIDDVDTLRAKLVEAQTLFKTLESRYERVLEAKERQLASLLSVLQQGSHAASARGPVWRQQNKGIPRVVSATEKAPTPRSGRCDSAFSRQDPTNARVRAAVMAGQRGHPQSGLHIASFAPGSARGSHQPYSARPLAQPWTLNSARSPATVTPATAHCATPQRSSLYQTQSYHPAARKSSGTPRRATTPRF